jgi:anaerobic selenocysteine-containing dehydrogenase
MVVLINPADMEHMGLQEADMVTLASAAGDAVAREVSGLRVTAYNIPRGCIAAYYPECNPLIPLSHYAERSKVPAAKSVPVTLRKMDADAETCAQQTGASV